MDPGGMKPAAGAGSTEERCPICLEDFQDKAFVNACFHTFCFSCVVRWAETTTTSCPLCKTAFSNVIHNVRANDDYDVFKVVPKPSSVSYSEEVIDLEGALRSFRGYRTTRFSGQPSQSQPSTSTSSATVQVVRPHPSRHRRGQKKDIRKPAAIQRRKAVYSTGLRALPLKSGLRPARVRDISASFFQSNPAATHRLYPWLTRELTVVVGGEHVQFIIQIITSLIDKVDLRSDEFPSYLEPYLHEKTNHFIHEFISFAASPFDMIAYDQNVSYDWPDSHPEHDVSERREDAAQGPSSEIQQRIFDEISSTSWDDPPPILETTSPSYLDHSSDTDYSGSEDTPTSDQTHVIAIDEEENRDETDPRSERIFLATNQNNLGADQRVNTETNQVNVETEGHCNEMEQVETREEPLAIIVDLTVENTTENVFDGVASTSRLQGQQVQRSIKTEDDSTVDYDSTNYDSTTDYVQLFAENESASTLNDYELCPLDNSEKDANTGHTVDKTKHSSKNRKKRRHKSKRDDVKSYTDKRRYERKESRRERTGTSSNSRDRSPKRYSSTYSHKHSRHGHDSKSRSYENSRHKDHRSHSPSRSNRESGRKNGHHSKIYSDELSPDDSSTQEHNSRHKTGPSGQARSVTSLDEDHTTKSCKALSNELNGLEKQITDNKRDLLKSMLRRERIELLRNSLHPCPPDPLPTPSSLRGGASVGDMQSELNSLESAILNGKKHLLRVMKRIEEDQADESD